MKKDVSIAIAFCSFFIQRPGKPQHLIYRPSFCNSDLFGMNPGYCCATIGEKQHLH